MKTLKITLAALALVAIAGCSKNDVASQNLSAAADNFEIVRRIVFYNGVTGEDILSIQGLCALGNFDAAGEVTVTCKTGPDAFKKHFLGLSDNVTFFAEQIDPAPGDAGQYRVIFRPTVIVPAIELQ
jgi:hypothetical protein